MKVSRAAGYAFAAAGYIAQHESEGIILSQTISKRYKIPFEYLLKIMQYLVKANILRSKRGPRGGFTLARPASKITMLDIIEAAEGAMNMTLGLDEYAPKDKFCIKTEQAYKKVVAQTKDSLKKVKLSDLV